MAASRRSGRGATRGRQGTPGWMWLLTGVLIGLGLAWYLFAKGYIPQPEVTPSEPAEVGESLPGGDEEVAPRKEDSARSQYDFFTVLPEMEVVVPEQELSRQAQPQAAATPGSQVAGDAYVLQVGSFREANDAEQLKARLALLGVIAQVQSVTVNDATWHRVRVGPVASAREADDLRGRLANNGIDSLVMKNQ